MVRNRSYFLLGYLLILHTGCGKPAPSPIQVAPPPKVETVDTKTKKEPPKKINPDEEPAEVKMVPMDLSPHGVFAVIDVPEETKVKQTRKGIELKRGSWFSLLIYQKSNYNYTESTPEYLSDAKKYKKIKEEKNLVVASTIGDKDPKYVVFFSKTINDSVVFVELNQITLKLESSLNRIVQAVQSIRDTKETQEKFIETKKLLSQLEANGCVVSPSVFGYSVKANAIGNFDNLISTLKVIPAVCQLWLNAEKEIPPEKVAQLKDVRGILFLTLSGKGITSNVVSSVQLLKLIELTILDSSITDAVFQDISKISTLESLVLARNRLNGSGFVYLKQLENFTSLLIDSALVNDQNIERLQSESLRRLSLAMTGITDKGMKAISRIINLEKLDLSFCQVSDKGLESITNLKKLIEINLTGTQITSKGFALLSEFPNLLSIECSNCFLDDMAIDHLASMTAQNRKFLLNSNNITDAKLDLLKDKQFSALEIMNSDISIQGAKTLQQMVQSPGNKIRVGPFPDTKPRLLKPEPIEKWHEPNPAKLLEQWKRVPTIDATLPGNSIVEIDLSKTDITDQDLAHLRNLNNLRLLNLSDCIKITDAGLQSLSNLKELQELNLKGTAIHGDGFIYLKNLMNLRKLILPNVKIYDEQLNLLKSLVNLEYILFLETVKSSSKVRFLSQLPQIKSLDLSESSASNFWMPYVSQMKNLRDLVIGGSINNNGLPFLKDLTNLETLKLSNQSISDLGMTHLTGLSNLLILDLRGCRISDMGLASIRELRKLDRLLLDGRYITDLGADYLRGLVELSDLEMPGSMIKDRGLEMLSDLDNLAVLNVAGSNITDKGLEHVRKMKELKSLDISQTVITGTTLESLAEIPKLQHINLSGTQINDETMTNLRRLTELQRVGLAFTNITDISLDDLKSLPALKEVDLSGTKIKLETIDQLRKDYPHWKIITDTILK